MTIAPITSGMALPASEAVAGARSDQSFGSFVEQILDSQTKANAAADKAIESLATGQADNLHSVSLAVAEADLQFRLILEMRNRITEAYQEIMRMQV